MIGCVAPDEETIEETTVESTLWGDATCSIWNCGSNAATVGDGIVFDELDLSGRETNAGGVRYLGAVTRWGEPVKLDVYRDHFYAYSSWYGFWFDGANLEGTVLTLEHVPTGEKIEVQIYRYDPQALHYWAGDAEVVPSYEMRARRPALGETKFDRQICKGDNLASDPGWNGKIYNALVYEWDRLDAARKLDTEVSRDTTWFNLACAGTAMAKLHLVRHTRAGSYNAAGAIAYDTTQAQRTMMLKLITADYCGKGQSFTVDGTPLWYMDATGYLPRFEPSTAASRESVWTAAGAACLDTPRLSIYTHADIEAKCGFQIPRCDGMTDWRSYGGAISANPP
ncbi:MAG TPA: ADYC domain-containing protein [Kofleriaceae bacterium]|nr:ADYC domain-containing protein [Kofleriaceae bacterium]